TGLDPDQTYHYRFVALSSGSDNEPVVGVGGTPAEEGDAATFHTFPPPLPLKTDCPNQQFRIGSSAPLPECRAFEMVSPVDKNGGDIATQKSIKGFPASLDVSATDGETVTYSSSTAFAGASSSPFVSQYIADRTSSGWNSRAVVTPREDPFLPIGNNAELDLQDKTFS